MTDGVDVFVCPFCGRNDFKRKGDLTLHIKYCKENPNRVESPNKGRKTSDETKKKISESGKIAQNRPDVKQKNSESQKIAQNRPDVKRKKSVANKIIAKKRYENIEERKKLSEIQKSVWQNEEVRKKHSIGAKKVWENSEFREAMLVKLKIIHNQPDVKYKKRIIQNSPETKQKIYKTKKKNGTFNTSKIECQLKNYFDSNNIEYISQYKSDLYPFMCDFYFPNKDLYVEIQGSWTHGGKPFIETDPECIEQLKKWKSKNTKFYNVAIHTWTDRDVKKREIAKMNELNWIEIFSNDLETCINIIINKLC